VPEEVEYALNIAGENRKQLVKVLRHYSKKKEDSLKFEAACYLIANMPRHYALYHKNPEKFDAAFEIVGKFDKEKVNKRALWDSVAPVLSDFNMNNVEQIFDINIINADFLIENIEKSFYAWKNYPWCSEMDFKVFKENILPYRSSNEPLENLRGYFQEKYSWINDSLKGEKSMDKAFTLVYNDFESWFETSGGVKYPIPMSFSQLLKAKGGRCDDECNLLNMFMKSLGIISAIEHTPHWANRNSGHGWVDYINEQNKPLLIDNDKILRKHQYLHSAEFDLRYPADKYLPDDIVLARLKKGAKVFRKSFEINPNSIILNIQNEEIPDEINNMFSIDVSCNYLVCHDVELELKKNYNKEVAYLCVFDLGSFYPVHWAKVVENKVKFKSMGFDVLYFPAVYSNNRYILLSNPFFLEKDGTLRHLKANLSKKRKVILNRKYPLFGNILNHANRMYNARFQGSNKEDFSDAVDLYTIKNTPIVVTEINTTNTDKFRYFRYLPDKSTFGDIAEIKFLSKENGVEILLEGTIKYKHKGPNTKNYSKAFDNDLNSYYMSEEKGTWIGIDLGEGIKKRVTKIYFCPRTDTNFIIPGNDYELFYWDNDWCSLGKKTAKNYFLEFDNAPEGALFWLHCHSGGKEERPFTYENGKQIWW